jgi:hypothetical protein
MFSQSWRWGGRKVPMNSLLDLFLFISRDLETKYGQKGNAYRLVAGSMTADLDIIIDKAHFHEVLVIEKAWDPSTSERVCYMMDYEEPHIAEIREREKLKTEPDGDWCYRAHLTMGDRDRFLSNEMYVDNLTILATSVCRFAYETTSLGRGLQSIAHLKMPPHMTDDQDAKEALPAVFSGMLRKGDSLLASQLGSDRTNWKRDLRRGRVRLEMPFEKEIDNVFPVWIVGRYLVDLCRVYARSPVN